MGRAATAFRAGRKPPKHAPKGTDIGGQFIGPRSVAHALLALLTGTGGKGSPAPPVGSLTGDPRMGFARPRLLAQVRKKGVKLKRGAPQRDIVAALRERSRADAPNSEVKRLLDNWERFGEMHGLDMVALLNAQPRENLEHLARARGVPLTGDRGRLQWALIMDAAKQVRQSQGRSRGDIPSPLRGLPRATVAKFSVAPAAGARPQSAAPRNGGRVDESGLAAALSRWRRGTGPATPWRPFATRALRGLAKQRGLVVPARARRWQVGDALLSDERRRVRSHRAFLAQATSRDFHLNLDDPQIAELRDGVRSGIVSERSLAGGQIGDTRLVVFGNGRRAVKKISTRDVWGHSGADQADAEQLASLLGRAFGAPVPPVFRHDAQTVFMGWVDGTEAASFPDAADVVKDTDGAHRLGLFDLLINQTDRHEMNWMVDAAGNPVGIDHGLTFTGLRAPRHPPSFHHQGFTGPFMARGKWIDNDLTSADIQHVRTQIETLRPDFAKLGKEQWLDFALARLAAIEPHAKGKFNRIAPGGPQRPPAPRRFQFAPSRIVDIAGAIHKLPAARRRQALANEPTDVLRQLPAAHGRRMFDQFGGQTAIEAMPRAELLQRLGDELAPDAQAVAKAVAARIATRQWDWQIGIEVKQQPVAVIRAIAMMQSPGIIQQLGGADAIAKMPKPDLVRMLPPAILGQPIPAKRVRVRRDPYGNPLSGGAAAIRLRQR